MKIVNDTALRLLTTAERLFAEEGIDGVSTRRISAAANQRNTSALHYHFGSKEALLDAILEFRMGPINERRLQLLADVERRGFAGDVRALVEVLVLPFVEQAFEAPAASYYASLMSQLYSRQRYDLLYPAGRARMSGLQRTTELLRDALGAQGVAEAERERRLDLMGVTLIHTVAGWVSERRGSGSWSRERLADRGGSLVDYLVGGLTAPQGRQWRLASA